MDVLLSFFDYISSNFMILLEMTYEHILMVIFGVLLALVIGIPLGVASANNKRIEFVILTLANMIQVIPSLALLAILMIIFGLGFKTVVIGLALYSLLPIIRNTTVGLKEVDYELVEAGTGVGMTRLQLLFKVKFPLSLPFLLAGIRIALVIGVGVATIAPFIGGGGLGSEIISGINLRNSNKIYAGAIFASILGILLDYLIGKTQKRIEKNR